MSSYWSRREFLEFMGRTSAAALLAGPLASCSHMQTSSTPQLDLLPFRPLAPQSIDDLLLAEGFTYRKLLSWDDPINKKGDNFGFNNDYIDWVPVPGKIDELILWVNHEYTDPLFVSGVTDLKAPRRKQDVVNEMKTVGGSLLHFKKAQTGWEFVPNSTYNRRISAETPIPFNMNRKICGQSKGIGTLANCAGGKTPDNKILTCEENYDQFFGEVAFTESGERQWRPGRLQWHQFFNHPPEHYGWVVEVDPLTGKARKLTGLGRMAHECATVTVAADGRWVAYTGDDANDECIYKFVGTRPGQLDEGTLYVADIPNGRWIALDRESNNKLKAAFKDHTDLLIQTRKAAALVGGTPMNRPEDIEIDKTTGDVFITLTNNKPKGDLHGSILKIKEKDADPTAVEFEAETFLAGGTKTGFSCPDNLAFDSKGDLWITSDISGGSLNKKDYKPFGNNGLFYIPLSGPNAGFVFQMASAPNDAELTGPKFSPDGSSLFLSIQHPGEKSTSLNDLTSHWPDGGDTIPRSSIVEIQGPFL